MSRPVATKDSYPSWLPLLLGFLSATGPLSTDMYLPAFPAIEAEYHLPLGSAQVTLAAWFVGLAIGQITQGTLADRYGRRLPLMISTAMYTMASAGCALAPDINTLTVLRLVAAIAGSAALVIPTAVVRDLSTGHAAAQMTSRLIMIRGVAPIIAPPIGSLILAFASWHGIFWFATIYGAICWVLVAWKLPDTLPPEARIQQNLAGMLERYRNILVERIFLVHALLNGASMFALFAFLGGSPGVFIDGMHLSPGRYALVFSGCAASYVVFAQFNPFMLKRFGADRVIRVTSLVIFFTNLILLIIGFLAPLLPGGLVWWMLMPPVMVMMGCQGFHIPNSTVGAMHRHAAHAGLASALIGMIGFCLAATSGMLAGVFSDGTARGMAGLMFVGGAAVLLADWFRRRLATHA